MSTVQTIGRERLVDRQVWLNGHRVQSKLRHWSGLRGWSRHWDCTLWSRLVTVLSGVGLGITLSGADTGTTLSGAGLGTTSFIADSGTALSVANSETTLTGQA